MAQPDFSIHIWMYNTEAIITQINNHILRELHSQFNYFKNNKLENFHKTANNIPTSVSHFKRLLKIIKIFKIKIKADVIANVEQST